ncbi:MAG: NnrS family protein, partial [Alphaproteobacteria bacterium]
AIAVLAVTEAAGGGGLLAAIAAATAGVVAGIRLVRWRAYGLLDEPELAVLYVGYGWLCLGLLLRAAAFAGAPIPEMDALHGITIGALGTLTMAVMGRATQQRALSAPHLSVGALVAIALVSAAAILRLLAAVPPLREPLLIAAGLSWVAAFALFAVFLAGLLRNAGARLGDDGGDDGGGESDDGAGEDAGGGADVRLE